MSLAEAVQRMEQCVQRFVPMYGKRVYFSEGLQTIKEHLEATAHEIQTLRAAAEKSVRVRKGTERRRAAPLNPRDLAALPTE